MKIMVRFLHISDLHIDRPFKGVTDLSLHALQVVRQSTFLAWQKIVQYAIEQQPDFILLVGDNYDGASRSLRAQQALQQGFEQLQAHNIPVIVSYGAHDYTDGVWSRFSYPDNVISMPSKTTTITLPIEGGVKITGCSYQRPQMPTALWDTYPQVDKKHIHIAMLYGEVTEQQLKAKGYDYTALGGQHESRVVTQQPYSAYSGTPQSTSALETGSRGFLDVTVTKGECVTKFIPIAPLVYLREEIDASTIRYANDLMVLSHNVCMRIRDKYQAAFVHLTLTNLTEEGSKLWHSTTEVEWLKVLREMESEQLPFVWLAKMEAVTNAPRPTTNAAQQVIETMHSWKEDDWQHVLASLYQNGTASRLLQETPIDVSTLLREAEQLFLRKMQES